MNKQDFEDRLNQIVPELYKVDKIVKDNKHFLDSYKQEVKDIFEELDIQNYEVDNVKINVQNVEKVSLTEPLLIEYLKAHGLTNLVKTKEYIDENEILMAVSKGLIPAVDIDPFTNVKIEKRLTIKEKK